MIKNDSLVVSRPYTAAQLRDVFDFCQKEFERFLGFLEWIDGLPDPHRAVQLRAAKDLYRKKKEAASVRSLESPEEPKEPR